MDSLVTYRNTKRIPCLIFLSTATSSILFDGGYKANASRGGAQGDGEGEQRLRQEEGRSERVDSLLFIGYT
jgi:hypothetical protein